MVEQQIRTWDVLDQPCSTCCLPCGARTSCRRNTGASPSPTWKFRSATAKCMLSPKLEARMLQELALSDDRPRAGNRHRQRLHDGAARAAGAAHVYSVEIVPEFSRGRAAQARRATASTTSTLEVGDGARGWRSTRPYDVIVLTGSVPVLPDAFQQQPESRRTPARDRRRSAGHAARSSFEPACRAKGAGVSCDDGVRLRDGEHTAAALDVPTGREPSMRVPRRNIAQSDHAADARN